MLLLGAVFTVMTAEQKQLVEEIKAKLAKEAENTDYESAHINADNLLRELLSALGLNDVVEIYSKVGKWYA